MVVHKEQMPVRTARGGKNSRREEVRRCNIDDAFFCIKSCKSMAFI